MDKHFGLEFRRQSIKAPKGGYPDCGNGLHSSKLNYGQWFEFNLAQRNAKNYLEVLTVFLFPLMILTLVWPAYAVAAGCLNLLFRTGYLMTYSRAPQLRTYFAPVMLANTSGAIMAAVYSCVWWHKQLI